MGRVNVLIFAVFWMAYCEVLLAACSTEERGETATVYASRAYLIPNLIKLATDILQLKVDSGQFSELPNIPSYERVRFQFVPNCTDSAAASKFTSVLQAKRAMQTRTLSKTHFDQHWVNAITRY